MSLYPRERWLEVSDVLIFHGRRVCHSRTPNCHDCAVFDLCPSRAALAGSRYGPFSAFRDP